MDDIVGDPGRCVLAVAGRHGPMLSPMACWSDGTALWMSVPAASAKAAALRRRPRCAVYVPPPGNRPPPSQERGSVVSGRARVYGPDDLLGLTLHAPAVVAAMTALAVRHASSLAGSLQDAVRAPWRLSWDRVAVKVAVHQLHGVDLPPAGAGIAPALPTEVPPEVRRALAGTRRAVLALGRDGAGVDADGDEGDLVVGPVVLGPGYAITGLDALGIRPQPAERASVPRVPSVPGGPEEHGKPAALLLIPGEGDRRPTAVGGLVLRGRLRGDRLEPARATWWQGPRTTTVTLAPRPAGSIVLPD